MDELAEGVFRIAVRSPTVPPATHTNCYLLGRDSWTVFDPASPWDDERQRLFQSIRASGRAVDRIVLTHHHVDHVSGAIALRDALSAVQGPVPIAAHAATRELLGDEIRIDEILEDGQDLDCGGLVVRVFHTPGHAAGHLVFLERTSGVVIAGDMVAGVGTILIAPPDGSLRQYLASLERMKTLQATALLPSHGPVLEHPEAILGFYVAHRHQRTQQVRETLTGLGTASPLDIAKRVYHDQPPMVQHMGAVQVAAHLTWLHEEGLVSEVAAGRWSILPAL